MLMNVKINYKHFHIIHIKWCQVFMLIFFYFFSNRINILRIGYRKLMIKIDELVEIMFLVIRLGIYNDLKQF